jgi:hypothetical protein
VASRRSARLAVLAIAVPGVIAAAAGFALAGGDEPAPKDPGTTALRAAGLEVTVPADWDRNRAGARRIDLGLSGTAAVGPAGRPDDGLTLGRGTASVALPPALVSALAEPPGEPQRVRFAAGDGHRYSGLRLRDGGNRLTVFLLPTTRGTAVLGCHTAASLDAAFASACEDAARTLRPVEGTVRPLSPDAAYGDALGAVMRRLEARERSGRSRLRRADAPEAQARAARALASSFRRARSGIAALAPPAGDEAHQRALERALASTAGAYGALASAASSDARGRYEAAVTAVARARSSVNDALAAYERAGYSG